MSKKLFSWRGAIASKNGPDSSTTRHVLLALSLHMSERGDSCFPSLNTLAQETGLTRRAIIDHIKKAIDDGWLQKERQVRESGGDTSNRYRPSVPKEYEHDEHQAFNWDTDEMEEGGEQDSPPGESDSRGGRTTFTPGVNEVHPNANTTNNTTSKREEKEGVPARERAGEDSSPPKPDHPRSGQGWSENASSEETPSQRASRWGWVPEQFEQEVPHMEDAIQPILAAKEKEDANPMTELERAGKRLLSGTRGRMKVPPQRLLRQVEEHGLEHCIGAWVAAETKEQPYEYAQALLDNRFYNQDEQPTDGKPEAIQQAEKLYNLAHKT